MDNSLSFRKSFKQIVRSDSPSLSLSLDDSLWTTLSKRMASISPNDPHFKPIFNTQFSTHNFFNFFGFSHLFFPFRHRTFQNWNGLGFSLPEYYCSLSTWKVLVWRRSTAIDVDRTLLDLESEPYARLEVQITPQSFPRLLKWFLWSFYLKFVESPWNWPSHLRSPPKSLRSISSGHSPGNF